MPQAFYRFVGRELAGTHLLKQFANGFSVHVIA
jgi:hypothetical protein